MMNCIDLAGTIVGAIIGGIVGTYLAFKWDDLTRWWRSRKY